MPIGWWLFVLFAPCLCAGAGALVAHLAHHGRCERLQDRAYEDGWRDGRNKAEAFAGTMATDYPTVIVHPPSPGQHARPGAVSDGTRAAVALVAIRSEFDRIRELFHLDGIEGPAPSRAAEHRHLADAIGPPSGELLRPLGYVSGPPWPIAPRPE